MEESLDSIKKTCSDAWKGYIAMDKTTPEPIEKCIREWLIHCMWKMECKIHKDRDDLATS